MKKFKEKILKIGNTKKCFIALLLFALISISILTGLIGQNSAGIKANAFTEAPQEKNLDLNGIRYTYQTSLNELRNDYNLFNYTYGDNLFTIVENTESEVFFELYGQEYDINLNSEEVGIIENKITHSIDFYNFNNDFILTTISEDQILSNQKSNQLVFTYNNDFRLKDFYNFTINFYELLSIPYINNEYFTLGNNSYGTQGMNVNFVYLNDSYDSRNTDKNYLRLNSKFYSYAFSKIPVSYNFNVPRFEGYHLQQIYCTFINEETVDYPYFRVPTIYNEHTDNSYTLEYAVIDNLKFYEDDYNTISYNFDFLYDKDDTIYKGNILLSDYNSDEEFVSKLVNSGNKGRIQKFNGVAIFGGNFENNEKINSFNYVNELGAIVADTGSYEGIRNQGALFRYNNPVFSPNITYFNQNKLLYLSEINDLKIVIDETEYSGLSSQVEDILYNVNYVGNVEEIERNQRIQEDLNNLLKNTGLGAVIGLIIGALFGNPVLGLVIGGLFGFFTSLFPLLIDGLQAIFGNNFLSGLYNFFKSITNFFANIVDTIINFLVNIITNPFVLILIVIIALIYLIKKLGSK